MFAVDMEIDQAAAEYTMNLTNNTGIPLEYVEFELKHSKVMKMRMRMKVLYLMYYVYILKTISISIYRSL